MALKRTASDDAVAVPQKRSRKNIDEPEDEEVSDGDYKVNFTDAGERRAKSEARRQWNYICPVQECGQRFNRPCRLDIHMRSHNKERPFACTEDGCDKTFPRKDHLQRHIKNAHNDQDLERTFVCDWEGCDKSFTSNGRLQRHRDVHESKFYCTAYPPCKEVFRKQCTLDAHIKSEHLAIKPHPCTFNDPATGQKCTAGYQSEGALRKHIAKIHSDSTDKAHFCMLCVPPESVSSEIFEPPSFATKEELQQHNDTAHPPVCPVCAQHFKTTSTLKSHFDTLHADPSSQPSFPCPEPDCKSTFNRKHNLTVHIQTVHEHQFKYLCLPTALSASKHADLRAWSGENACGAAFKAKSSLDQHVRTHHLGLGNRKAQRKAAKSSTKAKKELINDASTLTMLTGVGYEAGRAFPCAVEGCPFRFSRDCDVRRHMSSAAHGLSDEQVDDMLREREAMSGGQFWIGGLDALGLYPGGVFDAASTEASVPQTPAGAGLNGQGYGAGLYESLQYYAPGPDSSNPGPGVAKAQHDDTTNLFAQPHAQAFDFSLLDEDAEMDMAMGLDDLAPATDIQGDAMTWDPMDLKMDSTMDMEFSLDALKPVSEFNMST